MPFAVIFGQEYFETVLSFSHGETPLVTVITFAVFRRGNQPQKLDF